MRLTNQTTSNTSFVAGHAYLKPIPARGRRTCSPAAPDAALSSTRTSRRGAARGSRRHSQEDCAPRVRGGSARDQPGRSRRTGTTGDEAGAAADDRYHEPACAVRFCARMCGGEAQAECARAETVHVCRRRRRVRRERDAGARAAGALGTNRDARDEPGRTGMRQARRTAVPMSHECVCRAVLCTHTHV